MILIPLYVDSEPNQLASLRWLMATGAPQNGQVRKGLTEGASVIGVWMQTSQPVLRMPVFFVGHGSPLNAIEENAFSRGFQNLARFLPTQPQLILSVSAHWFVPYTALTGNPWPETIHDFGGFPDELFRVQYPAPGDPAFSDMVADLLRSWHASVRLDWGLDHGTWSVLRRLRAEADVPVIQLSIDSRMKASEHLAVGRGLASLRDRGVLIMGSGNITHNLPQVFAAMKRHDHATPSWASSFDAEVARAIEQHDGEWLSGALSTDAARMAHPTPEHFLPLLYAFGASGREDLVRFPITGFDMGSLSMRAVVFS